MVTEGTPVIFITFLLAIIGYAGLTIVLLITVNKDIPIHLWWITTIIILMHVLMVWAYRYEWQFFLSVRNGYAGFGIFHSALLLILLSNFFKNDAGKILIRLSFLIVTTGAVGASFRYDVVSMYRIPVIIFALTGMGSLIWLYTKKYKS